MTLLSDKQPLLRFMAPLTTGRMIMAYILPGPKTSARLHAGKTLFRHGLNYDEDAVASAARGFIPPAQIILDRAEGDYVWDLDDNI